MSEKLYDSRIDSEARWVEELKCFVHGINYDYECEFGTIFLLTGNCSDMSGAISLFERIDPNVKGVATGYLRSDKTTIDFDTVYHKVHGKWVARRSDNPRPVREAVLQ